MQKRVNTHRKLGAAAAAIALMSLAAAASAQTASTLAQPSPPPDTAPAPASAAAPTAGAADSGDIIVTAQRRSQRLQDVPATVIAISGQSLVDAGVQTTNDLESVSPGVVIAYTANAVQPTIRGVGTRGSGAGDESNVPIYLDGIYQTAMQSNSFELLNVARVEVLKGPQGTLFGRNATGGAINIVTSDPDPDGRLLLEAGYASYKEVQLKGYGAAGVAEGFAVDLAAQYTDDGGYVRDLLRGGRIGDRRSWSARGRALVEPSDALRFILAVSQTRTSDPNSVEFQPFRNNTRARVVNPTVLIPAKPRQMATDLAAVAKSRQTDVNLRGSLDLGFASLQSDTDYQRNDSTLVTDSDGTSLSLGSQLPISRTNSWYEELRLVSSGGGRFNWLAGAQVFHASSRYLSFPVSTGNNRSRQRTRAYAAFAEGTYDITDTLTLLAGIRYSDEKRLFLQNIGNRILFDGAKSWSSTNPHVSLTYKVSPAVNAYATYSTGFKTGLYNAASAVVSPPVNPERIKAYEVGLKTRPARGVTANLSLYKYSYDDLQAQARDANNQTLLTNAAKASIKGVDFDAQATPLEGLNLRFGVSYVDANYTSFPTASVSVPNGTGGAASCAFPTGRGTLVGGNTTLICDVSGNRLIRAPEWTIVGGGTYELPTSFGHVGASANANYNGGFYTEFLNRIRQPAYTDLTLSLYAAFADRRYRLTVYTDNLLNEDIFAWSFTSANGDFASYRAPRTFGVRWNAEF